jgi:hypothetical protein
LALGVPWVLAGIAGALAYLVAVLRLGLVSEDMIRRVRAALVWRSSKEVLS